MRIVITGVLGHIGSFLSHNLPSTFPGCEIIMIDSLKLRDFRLSSNCQPVQNINFLVVKFNVLKCRL